MTTSEFTSARTDLPVPTRDRADAMLRRVLRTATRHGIPDPSVLERAWERAMGPRLARLDDDHDPRFLHPGRTALILMDDLGETDSVAVAAGLLAETESLELRTSLEPAEDDGPPLRAALALARGLPRMEAADELAEALLLAPDPVSRIALAEYLDQLRHLRLWADAARIEARGRLARDVLAPLAERVHPVLARRYRWWVRRVLAPEGG